MGDDAHDERAVVLLGSGLVPTERCRGALFDGIALGPVLLHALPLARRVPLVELRRVGGLYPALGVSPRDQRLRLGIGVLMDRDVACGRRRGFLDAQLLEPLKVRCAEAARRLGWLWLGRRSAARPGSELPGRVTR